MKICFKCNISKELTEFYKHPETTDGRMGKCKECNKKDVQANYSLKKEYYGAYDKKRQRHSVNRILSHRYTSIRQRVEGRGIHKYSSLGLDVCTKEEFFAWYEKTKESFQLLYDAWEASDFTRSLAPSIDRIDNSVGYTPTNMQWLTQSENSRKYTT